MAAALNAPNDGLLPTDVLREILLRLPANVLCRFRLVCRSWRSLTSDPIFAKAHSSRHPLVVCLHADAGRRGCSREIRFVDLSGNIVKRISTGQDWDGHGLTLQHNLLCVTHVKGKACVVHPATGAITVLPSDIAAKHENNSTAIYSMSIIGQVPSTGEYKVLRIHRYHMDDEPEQTCDVITLGGSSSGGAGSWRVRQRPPIRVMTTSFHEAVVGGVAYFLLDGYLLANVKRDAIASFDLATEEWRSTTFRGPLNDLLTGADDEHRISLYLARLNGCLVTICRNYQDWRDEDCCIDLWFSMDIDKGLWTKRYCLRSVPSLLHEGLVFPLVALDNERILLWVNGAGILREYNTRASTSTNLATIQNCFSVSMYQGSLLCSS
ncbi:hypothetical protein ACP70R_048157 [Stipagrostis hirtigluma subsp. patula]